MEDQPLSEPWWRPFLLPAEESADVPADDERPGAGGADDEQRSSRGARKPDS